MILKGKTFLNLTLVLALSACTKAHFEAEEPWQEEEPTPAAVTSTRRVQSYVCDPFSQNPSKPPSIHEGLLGELWLPPTGLTWTSLDRYFTEGTRIESLLFFSEVNVPTRSFSEGFPTSTGLLKNPSGQNLLEWFGIHFTGFLKVNASEAGRYAFAVISDDGSRFEIEPRPGEELLIDYPETTSSRMHCPLGRKNVVLDANSRTPISLKYFQGPKTEIAVTLLWKKVENGTELDPADYDHCGDASTTLYRSGGTWLNDVLARGWSPIPSQNLELPNDADGIPYENPCAK